MNTHISKLDSFKTVMNEVYGHYEPGKAWAPKLYKEGKGRYLWTDAFGVCNFITLYYETGESRYLDQADSLIRDVHNTLGKDRAGKSRLGGATEESPTKGGLRIGKEDEEGLPDGDGQYFHYLTKWMFALSRMSLARQTPVYNNWAIQMAQTIHPKFVHKKSGNRLGMFWKMSIDLSRPHVQSEGNLDPFDGLITYRLLQEVANSKEVLKEEIEDMNSIVEAKYRYYDSDDPLDLGEALWLSHFFLDDKWAKMVTKKSLQSLEMLWVSGMFSLDVPVKYRLAFREFGTTLGVQVTPEANPTWADRVELIHKFWAGRLYTRDRDITPVMYCASLIPGVFHRSYKSNQAQ